MISVKKAICLGLILLVLGISGVLIGCNKSVIVEKLKVKSDFYQQHGYFLGNKKVKLEVDLANFNEEDLVFYWQANGGRFLSQGESKVTYLTPKVPGSYSLQLGIKDGKQTLTTFNFSFTVKGDYPAEVILKQVTNKSIAEGVRLNWSQYPEQDFYGYKILRSNNFYIDEKAKVIASINDKSNTSFIDHNIVPDQVYTYQIMVTNESGYVSASNEKKIEVLSKGMRKIRVGKKLSQIVINSNTKIGYVGNLSQKELMILDLKETAVTRRLELSIAPEILTFSAQKKYLFVAENKAKTLLRINLDNLRIKKYAVGFPIVDLAVDNEYLYLLTREKKNLVKFDIDQGIVTKRKLTWNGNSIMGNSLEIVDDRLLIEEVFGPVLTYNLQDLSHHKKKFNLGSIEDMKLGKIGRKRYLYVGSAMKQSIQALQGIKEGQLEKVGEFETGFHPAEFTVEEKSKLLIAACETKQVFIFSLTKYNLLEQIKLNNYVFDLAVDQSQDKLYLLTADIAQTNYKIITVKLKTKGGHYIWNGAAN